MRTKVIKTGRGAGKAVQKTLGGIFGKSLQTYYWWSTLFYLSAFIALHVVTPRIDEFFCDVDPLATSGGKGCDECPDTLIFCDLQDDCYRRAMNATYNGFSKESTDTFYQDLQKASSDKVANTFTMTLDMATVTPLSMIEDLTDIASQVDSSTLVWHCEVLRMALGQFDFPPSKPDVWGVGENCPKSAYAGVNFSAYCPIPTPTPTARMLSPCDTASEGAEGGCERSAFEEVDGGRKLTDEVEEAASSRPFSEVQGARRLTDEEPVYTVSEWTQCQCYQRCMPGLKTRSLICSSDDGCSGSPADSEVCECQHCARCDVKLHEIVLWYTSLIQVIVSFLSFLAYLHGSTINEDSLVQVSFFSRRWLPGFVCKWLPSTVKYCVVANMVNLSILTGRIYAPDVVIIPEIHNEIQDATGDCRASESLVTLYMVLVVLWVFQVALSAYAQRYFRPPPWLMEPQRAGSLFNGIRKLTACFGP